MRLDGYHLYFRAAKYGSLFVFLAGVSFVMLYAISGDALLALASKIKLTFNKSLDVDNSSIFNILIVAMIGIIYSRLAAWFLNFLIPGEFSFYSAIKNDDLELLLYRALVNDDTIAISMENKKEYIGYVVRGFEPEEERKFLRILPMLSGFRDKATGKITYTTPYEEVIKHMCRDDNKANMSSEDFEMILPVLDIKSAHIFDIETYNAFQRKHRARSIVNYSTGPIDVLAGRYINI
jgi:hypothetical protein